MKLAYLTNQYPKVSHSFIRREILALEEHGLAITRYSIRRAAESLPDALDQREATRTTFLLEQGGAGLLSNVFKTAFSRPLAFASALRLAYKMGRGSQRGLARHFVYLAEACMLRSLCAGQGITHLHVHHGTNPAAVAVLCRVLGGPPYSLTVHGPEEFENAARLSLPIKLASAAFVISVSEYGRRELASWCDSSTRAKIYVVHPGVGDRFLNHSPFLVPDNRRLLWVGRLTEQKDPLVLVHAIALLRGQNMACTVTMIGDGPLRTIVEQAIGHEHLENVITLAGWASGEQILTELDRSRALVLSSRAENMPSVLMEAFARQRPVVSTDVGGIAELVREGETGWLVPRESPAALAVAIRHMLETKTARLNEMAFLGREIVRSHFSIQTETKHLLELFARAAGG